MSDYSPNTEVRKLSKAPQGFGALLLMGICSDQVLVVHLKGLWDRVSPCVLLVNKERNPVHFLSQIARGVGKPLHVLMHQPPLSLLSKDQSKGSSCLDNLLN